jgi:tRNA (mo5U34)-methyltransferase
MTGEAGTPRIWYHTIELPDGSTTPGWFDTRVAPRYVTWPATLPGGRCIDVGTFDGFWAFEMERRGAAEVVAVDLDDPAALDWSYDQRERGPEAVLEWGSQRGPGFADLAAKLNSKVKRVNRSVYDLKPEVDGTFDVVFCGSLLLHLRDPVRALEAMRGVCRGELVLVEALDPLLDVIARRVPCARVAPGWDQWWRVNRVGLHKMAEVAGFEVLQAGPRFLVPYGPGASPGMRFGRLNSLAARRVRERGQLHAAIRARPRAPRPAPV